MNYISILQTTNIFSDIKMMKKLKIKKLNLKH
jgi:hypothetical protein